MLIRAGARVALTSPSPYSSLNRRSAEDNLVCSIVIANTSSGPDRFQMLDVRFGRAVVIGRADQPRTEFLYEFQIGFGKFHVALALLGGEGQRRAVNRQHEFGRQVTLIVDRFERRDHFAPVVFTLACGFAVVVSYVEVEQF